VVAELEKKNQNLERQNQILDNEIEDLNQGLIK
jgi:cell division protein FtsB